MSKARWVFLHFPRILSVPHGCVPLAGSLPGLRAVAPALVLSRCCCSSCSSCFPPTLLRRRRAQVEPAPLAAQQLEELCPRTPPSFPQEVLLELRAPAVPPAPCRGSLAFFSAPFLSAPVASAKSACHECFSSSTRRLSSGSGAGPPAAGCHLPVLARVTSGDDWNRSSLPGACSKQLRPPNLATGQSGRSSPDPRPRVASFRAGPTPGRLAARCLVASSNAGLLRWSPTSSEIANDLDSNLPLRPSCGTL